MLIQVHQQLPIALMEVKAPESVLLVYNVDLDRSVQAVEKRVAEKVNTYVIGE